MEQPERKKLKSTYKPAAALDPLPPGWSEHSAPTGHKYFYNAATKQSTYTRPAPVQQQSPAPYHSPPPAPFLANHAGLASYAAENIIPALGYSNGSVFHAQQYSAPLTGANASHVHNDRQQYPRQRPPPQDRPKRKAVVPDCAPWIVIYTKLGRRFVHNTETQESLWKFPPHVMKAVIEFDRIELEKKLGTDGSRQDEDRQGTGANDIAVGQGRRRRSASLQREDEEAMAAEMAALDSTAPAPAPAIAPGTLTTELDPSRGGTHAREGDSSSEYEEIEVTDSEDEGNDNEGSANRTDAQLGNDQPVEFDEDDIAYQLAAMGESYGLDPEEYGDEDADDEEGTSGLPLTADDSIAVFHALLDDWNVSPYTPWEALLADDAGILTDERFTVLPSSRARHAAWDSWTRTKITALRTQRAATQKQDPRVAYLDLLATHGMSGKLYWAEFKRKHRKDAALLRPDPKLLPDKEKERLYREHVARLKMPARQLAEDLRALMKSLPLRVLHRDTALDDLPEAMRADVRFVSLLPGVRDEVVRAHLATLRPSGGCVEG